MARVMSIRTVDDAMAIRNAYDVFDPPVTKTVVRCLGDLANHESFMCFGIVWPFKMCCCLSISLPPYVCRSVVLFAMFRRTLSLSATAGGHFRQLITARTNTSSFSYDVSRGLRFSALL